MSAESEIGLVGLAVMGQNLALNIAEKGFPISVHNRSNDKVDAAEERAKKSGLDNLTGYKDMKDFVQSLQKPRRIILLVKAGKPVDATIDGLMEHLEEGDIIIDGGNEWYENSERRMEKVAEKGIRYMAMGVSGGEEGARNGPSMMPGGSEEAYSYIEKIVTKVAAQVDDGPCVTYIGSGGSGNFVKMVHNGIEYGDMQLIAEAYDMLKNVGGMSNKEIAEVFAEWNKGELESFLAEITSIIFTVKDDKGKEGELLDYILDKTGSKGTGKWTVQQAAEMLTPAPTIAAALDGRYLSSIKGQRETAEKFYSDLGMTGPKTMDVDKQQLINDVRNALYASKICSYAQGMNVIKAKSDAEDWNVDLAGLARIWKGGCIIRAGFLDRIKSAYQKDPKLDSLLLDEGFAKDLVERYSAWTSVVKLAVDAGVAIPGIASSLAYFDTYRRGRTTANLVQAQRDFFGSHTYERTDMEGSYHTVWDETFGSKDSITTTGYNS